jgi:hypothetical protein
MAAHFRDLHISCNHKSKKSESSIINEQADMDVETANAIKTDDTQPKLVFSEELKQLQQEPILPSTFLSKL